ncbi:GNAT family N-acetyltransferase [Oscillochloris sp. ZM17-4]|uniref:GNAT family N-acetyltransferase n=1 Tax=Oscillochloris sp. ZM17-4 TaxID=2866714 RepID=UPI001C73DB0C|nr:GNAT family N-acetyltransferase [Oscillochloris sp. ZM17-4]
MLESCLEFPADPDGLDYRLAAFADGRSHIAAAVIDGAVAGVAEVEERAEGTLDLLWLETRPSFRGQGAGQALLAWARTQAAGRTLRVATTPASANFYARHLPDGAVTVA